MERQAQSPPAEGKPVLAKALVFSLGLALLFTLVANILPQVEGEAPVSEEVDLGALTMDSFVALGESVFKGKGTCTLCHNNLGRAPDLLAMNAVDTAIERLADLSYEGTAGDAEGYLRESMIAPGAYVVKGFGKKGTSDTESPMPSVDKPPIELSTVEMDAVIAFMQAKDGNPVTVALPSEAPEPAPEPAPADVPPQSAETPEAIVTKYGCAACHTMLGTESPVGPELDAVGARLSTEEIRESVIDPAAVITEGFPPGVMPADFADRMTIRELEMLVNFLVESRE